MLCASDKTLWGESPTLAIFCSTTDASRPASAVSTNRRSLTLAESNNKPDMPEEDDAWEDEADPAAMTTSDRLAKIRMASLVKQYLEAQSLEVLVERGLEDAVMRFVDKDDKDAIKE